MLTTIIIFTLGIPLLPLLPFLLYLSIKHNYGKEARERMKGYIELSERMKRDGRNPK